MISWPVPDNLNFLTHKRDGLIPLFLSGVSRRVAAALLSLFSPIYIFQIMKNFGGEQRLAIMIVLLYYLIILFSKLLSLVVAENLSQKAGFKSMIWASFIPFVVFIISLVLTSSWPVLFLVAALAWGIHSGFFWWGYHGYFIKAGDEEYFGHSIGKAGFLETSALVLSPFLGAIAITIFGFNALFFLSGIFMILALFFLGKDHDKRQRRDIVFKDILSLIKSHKSISLAYIGSSAESILYLVVWPLFLFLFFGQVLSLGIIVSAAVFLAAVFSLVVGRWVDKQGERTIVSFGTPLVAISWIIRLVQKSLPAFIVADTLWNFGQKMVVLPLRTLTYKKAVEGGSARAILFRETTMTIGGVASLLLFAVWIFLGGGFDKGFIMAAVLSMLPLVAVFKKRLYDKGKKKN